MDADDLVITLKKSLAKLSRTERRKAVELVGDIVRAAMFDDAAGDDYEIERCPRCGSTAVVKKGKSRNGDQRYLCRGCGKTFSGSTGRVLGTSKLPRETWMAYAECFVLMLPLRECAGRCGVCLKTAYTMRHRLIECLKAYSPDFRVGRGGACELDETYFPESFKGNHSKGSFTLPRKARHRGKQVRRRGLSREQVCVMTGVSDTVLASIYFSPFSPTYFRQSRQRGCAGFANADAPLSASRLPPPSRPHRRWIRPSGGTTVPLS